MKLQTLPQRQAAMKRRLNHEKVARESLRAVGRPRATIPPRRAEGRGTDRNSCHSSRIRRVQTDWEISRQRLIEHYRNRKDFISSEIVVDADLLTNVNIGARVPPKGEPWIYFLFLTFVSKHQGRRGIAEHKVRYLQELRGHSRREVDDALVEFCDQPGVRVLDK